MNVPCRAISSCYRKFRKRVLLAAVLAAALAVALVYATTELFDRVFAPFSSYDRTLPHFRTNYSYAQLLTVDNFCAGSLRTVFYVVSRADDFQRRDIARKTWISQLSRFDAKAFFLLGTGDPPVQHRIRNEHRVYNDIVQMDFRDAYVNLTIKNVATLKWIADSCGREPSVRFAVRIDIDSYVNLATLNRTLASFANDANFIFGSVSWRAPVIRDRYSKWYCPRAMYAADFYPKYSNGFFYAMPVRTAELLYDTVVRLPYFHIDDVWITGVAAERAGVRLEHSDRVLSRKVPLDKIADTEFIVIHGYTAAEMYMLHDRYFSGKVAARTHKNAANEI